MNRQQAAQQLLAAHEADTISEDDLPEQAEKLGYDDEAYYDLCEYDPADEAWYPSDAAPRRDYSLLDHLLDWLREQAKS